MAPLGQDRPEGAALALPPADAVLEMHARLLERYGGPPGIRDEGALEAALARPQQLMAYGGVTSIPQIAAAIAHAICRIRHPFLDGNKRVAFAVLVVTLDMNGLALDVSETEAARIMQAVASGAILEDPFAKWVADNAIEPEQEPPGPAYPPAPNPLFVRPEAPLFVPAHKPLRAPRADWVKTGRRPPRSGAKRS